MTESNHPLLSDSPTASSQSEITSVISDATGHSPNQLIPYYDNGVINSLYVKSMDYGSMALDSAGVVLERTSIILILEPCQKALIQAVKAAKEGFPHFKILYRDDTLDIHSSWILHEPHVRAISFGVEGDGPRKVQVEVNYEILEIDGVKL